MDIERLRNLAASYRTRAKLTENEHLCGYEADMASYLESVVAWIEARQGEGSKSTTAPPKSKRETPSEC